MKKAIVCLFLLILFTSASFAQSGTKRYTNVTSIINDRFIGSEPIDASVTYSTNKIVLLYGNSGKNIVYEKTGGTYSVDGYTCFESKSKGVSGVDYIEYVVMFDPSTGSTAVFNPIANTLLLFE